MKINIKCIVLGVICVLFIFPFLGELVLRVGFGFCDAVLMRADDDYEYIAQPNQERRRFGHRVFYNSCSMRSDELHPESVKILCVGDSILNGGTLTDHRDLATTILSTELSRKLNHYVQVLNISAGSWGPDNAAAYLKKHGVFGAKAIVLVTSSHDARDTMTFIPVVGKLKYFPTRQYPLAWLELWDRYLSKRSTSAWLTKDEADASFKREHHIDQNGDVFNLGFMQLKKIADEHSIPFFIYLHPERGELRDGKFNPLGKEIIKFCEDNNVLLINGLSQGTTEDCYEKGDYIHLSPVGQRHLARCLLNFLLKASEVNEKE